MNYPNQSSQFYTFTSLSSKHSSKEEETNIFSSGGKKIVGSKLSSLFAFIRVHWNHISIHYENFSLRIYVERDSIERLHGSRSTEKETYFSLNQKFWLFLSVLSLASFLSCHWSPSSPKLGRSAHYTFMRHRSLLNVCMRVWLCEREYASMNTRKPRGDWNGNEIRNDARELYL